MRDDSAEILFQPFLQEAFVSGSCMGKNVHSLMLSIQHFLCQPRCHPPSKMPGRWFWEDCRGFGEANQNVTFNIPSETTKLETNKRTNKNTRGDAAILLTQTKEYRRSESLADPENRQTKKQTEQQAPSKEVMAHIH